MKFVEYSEHVNSNVAKILVVGVGGGGGNVIESLLNSPVSDNVKLVSINTDAQALASNKVPNKLQIGKDITNGRGAGNKPEVGKAAALKSYNEIKEILKY